MIRSRTLVVGLLLALQGCATREQVPPLDFRAELGLPPPTATPPKSTPAIELTPTVVAPLPPFDETVELRYLTEFLIHDPLVHACGFRPDHLEQLRSPIEPQLNETSFGKPLVDDLFGACRFSPDARAMRAFLHVLRTAIRSGNEEVSASAVNWCNVLRGPVGGGILPDLLWAMQHHAARRVRLQAVESVHCIVSQGWDNPSLYHLSHPEALEPCPSWPSLPAETLESLRGPLLQIARDSQAEGYRESALLALGYLRDPSIVPPVVAIFREEDKDLRWAAFRALVTMDAPEVRPIILEILGRRDDPLFQDAIDAAKNLNFAEARAKILPILNDMKGNETWSKQEWDAWFSAFRFFCGTAQSQDLPQLMTWAQRWTAATPLQLVEPILAAWVRLNPQEPEIREKILGHVLHAVRAASPDVRFKGACAVALLDSREGVAVWAGFLSDEARINVDVSLSLRISSQLWTHAIAALEELTGKRFDGDGDDQRRSWQDWWMKNEEQYRPSY